MGDATAAYGRKCEAVVSCNLTGDSIHGELWEMQQPRTSRQLHVRVSSVYGRVTSQGVLMALPFEIRSGHPLTHRSTALPPYCAAALAHTKYRPLVVTRKLGAAVLPVTSGAREHPARTAIPSIVKGDGMHACCRLELQLPPWVALCICVRHCCETAVVATRCHVALICGTLRCGARDIIIWYCCTDSEGGE